MNHNTLAEHIRSRSKKGQPALIPFLTAGIPSRETFWQTLIELADNGADIIEIGVPFSDPVADGPVVAKASAQALETGVDLNYIIQGLHTHKEALQGTGVVLMGYANPFVQYGWPAAQEKHRLTDIESSSVRSLKKLATDLHAAGVQGLIIPDLPLEESSLWREVLKPFGIEIIPLVGLNTPVERMQAYAKVSEGYVYVVAVLGITGVRSAFPPELAATLQRARQSFTLPLALGFGLEHPKQLDVFPKDLLPEAFVFGSALIRHLEQGGKAADFMRPWQAAREA